MTACPDCWVSPGEPHMAGCDVARCPLTGRQALSCNHAHAQQTIWTGEWPGVVECREFGWYVAVSRTTVRNWRDGFEDLNRLALAALNGEVVWDVDAQRWRKAVPDNESEA